MHFTKQGIVLAALAVTLPAVSPAASAADVLTAAVFGNTGSSSYASNARSRSLGTSTNPTLGWGAKFGPEGSSIIGSPSGNPE